MKQSLNPRPVTLPQRKAHKAASHKRNTWMPRLREHMFRMLNSHRLFR